MTEIRGIIPAINNAGQLEAFLGTDYPMCVIMNRPLYGLGDMFARLRGAGKQALVHCDLIHGLAPDEYGAEYLARSFGPDGIISTKPAVVSACRELGVTSVQRAFLIDSSALSRALAGIEKAKPDYVELLPALCTAVFPAIRRRIGVPLIAGGLIQSRAMAEKILSRGVVAVTISMETLLSK